jgi:hypothetical protein
MCEISNMVDVGEQSLSDENIAWLDIAMEERALMQAS